MAAAVTRRAPGRRARRWWLALPAVLIAALLPVAAQDPPDATPAAAAGESLELRVRPLPEGVRRVRLEVDQRGDLWYVLEQVGGGEQRVSPAEFADRLYGEHRDRSSLYRVLNITTPAGIAWVVVGLLGQVLFTGRMVLQWLVSERSKRSVVPVGFWWMSLAGATMLLVYFIWRKDIVGVLGQSAGWVIYGRNLWLIRRAQRDPASSVV